MSGLDKNRVGAPRSVWTTVTAGFAAACGVVAVFSFISYFTMGRLPVFLILAAIAGVLCVAATVNVLNRLKSMPRKDNV